MVLTAEFRVQYLVYMGYIDNAFSIPPGLHLSWHLQKYNGKRRPFEYKRPLLSFTKQASIYSSSSPLSSISETLSLQIYSFTAISPVITTKMGYPTNAEIKSLLESQFHSKLQKSDLTDDSESLFQFGHLDELFSDDVEVHISGHEFHLNGKHRGLDAFKEHLQSDDMPSLNSIIDVNKPIKGSVLHVIGGENDEWKAAVLHSTATTQNNTPWNHEMAVLMRFNHDGKITELRAYADTQHVHQHIEAHK